MTVSRALAKRALEHEVVAMKAAELVVETVAAAEVIEVETVGEVVMMAVAAVVLG